MTQPQYPDGIDASRCGRDCLMCSGEACNKCGAGCWKSTGTACDHDVIERHEEPFLGDGDTGEDCNVEDSYAR